MKVLKTALHRTGTVTVGGVKVGKFLPAPGGWWFKGKDGYTEKARTRGHLKRFAAITARRLKLRATPLTPEAAVKEALAIYHLREAIK